MKLLRILLIAVYISILPLRALASAPPEGPSGEADFFPNQEGATGTGTGVDTEVGATDSSTGEGTSAGDASTAESSASASSASSGGTLGDSFGSTVGGSLGDALAAGINGSAFGVAADFERTLWSRYLNFYK